MNQEQLNAIKERVAKATPGPWLVAYDTNVREHVDIWFNGEDNGHVEIHDNSFGNAPYNAKFISHAREDVPALVAEVERLQKLLNTEKRNYVDHLKETKEQFNRVTTLDAEVLRLRKALEFYANKNSHFRVDRFAESIVMQDEGEIARQALVGESDVERKQNHHT